MNRRKRIIYTAEQRALMWDRYQQGDSLADIARLFGRYHSSVERIIAETGGIRPPTRKRASRCLSLSEREEISRSLVAHESIRAIASRLSRSPSTISREINHNGGYHQYRASRADTAAWERAKRPKPCKLACNPLLSKLVARQLKKGWSPEQVSGWLKRMYSTDENLYVSHETIYKTLYIQARGALKKELIQCLRTRRTKRRSKHSSRKGLGQGKIVDAVSISERPPSVEDRAIPGHWEGDLIEGCNNTYIATLVERHSRYVMLAKLADKKTATVIAALIKQSKKLPRELYKSLTWDRGCELTNHKQFTIATNIQVYFCDPQSPWQRGSNENTNRLLREYLPKGTDLSVHSQARLNAIARQLNERPRKTLEFESPADRFNHCVASTG